MDSYSTFYSQSGAVNDVDSKRFSRLYEEEGFAICVNISKKGAIYREDYWYQFATFSYMTYGKSKMGKLDGPLNIDCNAKELVDLQTYWSNDEGYPGFSLESIEDSYTIAFNTLYNTVPWEAKLLTSEDKTIIMERETNILLCLNCNAIIAGNPLKRYGYMKLEPNQEYVVNEWDNAEVAIFSATGPLGPRATIKTL